MRARLGGQAFSATGVDRLGPVAAAERAAKASADAAGRRAQAAREAAVEAGKADSWLTAQVVY